jgi:hypothetical protein
VYQFLRSPARLFGIEVLQGSLKISLLGRFQKSYHCTLRGATAVWIALQFLLLGGVGAFPENRQGEAFSADTANDARQTVTSTASQIGINLF